MKRLITLLFFFTIEQTNAQQKTFSEEELTAVVKQYHPVVKQAGINVRIARAEVTASRGAFDPQWSTETGRKEFDGTTYYDQRVNELKIPTWYGINLYAGQENITGSRINPEETKGSLSYVGFSIPLLQNLLMDKRRAALLKAKNFQSFSEVERKIVVNDLMQEALKTYWDWWAKFHVHQLMIAAVHNTENRLRLVRMAYQLGDRPAIDTLEAFTQVQSFQIKLSEAYTELARAQLLLSTFLWTKNEKQFYLPEDVLPQDLNQANPFILSELLNDAATHPELRQYSYKLNGLQIDRQLAFQSLLPEVNIKYNQSGYNFSRTIKNAWFNNNYRYGVSFSLPLRFSEGRGEYQKAKLKMEATRLEQANKQVQLYTKVKQYYTEWQQTEKQLSLQTALVTNIATLQKGEETRFSNGESSLFLINTRQLKTIEAEQKAIELKSKLKKAVIGVRWAAGQFAQ